VVAQEIAEGSKTMNQTEPLRIGAAEFFPGEGGAIDLPIGSLTGYQPVTMHV